MTTTITELAHALARLAERRRVDRRADRRGAPVAQLDAARAPAGVPAELRPDRVHRHADHHGREEEDHRHLRRLHRHLPARATPNATARWCRSCTRAGRSRARCATAATWTRSSRTCSPTTRAEELEEIQRKYATKGDVMEAEKLIAAKAQEHPAALRRDGAAERLQGAARRAQPPRHASVPGRAAQRPRRAGRPDRAAARKPPATPTRKTWTGAPHSLSAPQGTWTCSGRWTSFR